MKYHPKTHVLESKWYFYQVFDDPLTKINLRSIFFEENGQFCLEITSKIDWFQLLNPKWRKLIEPLMILSEIDSLKTILLLWGFFLDVDRRFWLEVTSKIGWFWFRNERAFQNTAFGPKRMFFVQRGWYSSNHCLWFQERVLSSGFRFKRSKKNKSIKQNFKDETLWGFFLDVDRRFNPEISSKNGWFWNRFRNSIANRQ